MPSEDAKDDICRVDGYEPGCVFKLDKQLKWRCVECKRLKPYTPVPGASRTVERALNNV